MLTPAMALPVLLFVLLVLAAVVIALVARGRQRAPQRALTAAAASRPGWQGVPAPSGADLARRYRYQSPFSDPGPSFQDLMYGPLPGGAQAEVFHFTSTFRYPPQGPPQGPVQAPPPPPVVTRWTAAAVVFPRPLPHLLLQPGHDALPPGWPPGPGRSYDRAGCGPLWTGLRGYSSDPGAAAAVFTPEVLGRTRALGLDWRMDGRTVIAFAPEHRPPAAMLELVDQLAWFAALLPPEALAAAAGQPDPWQGPSIARPA
ncbi:hypothetical protein [Streptacidiphilus cavernicola]|uniref:DUF3137 domain-containing protein n=1 Tax=Streptacidiphilus cavernicola TaxID=3342716 RepID=A0ABV6VYS8_9ACTN